MTNLMKIKEFTQVSYVLCTNIVYGLLKRCTITMPLHMNNFVYIAEKLF